MSDDTHYLYRIIRKDGKKYIGVSKDPKARLTRHISGNGSIHLKGEKDLTLQVIISGSKEEIYKLEKYFIQTQKPELNRCPGGIGGFSGTKGPKFKDSGKQELITQVRELTNQKVPAKEIAKILPIGLSTVYKYQKL